MYYVSESVYQQHSLARSRPRPSFNVTNGLLVRKHSTLHDQANQAHKLLTLTLYVHWHYITKRDNPYHLPLLQIPNQNFRVACQRSHPLLRLNSITQGGGTISSSSSIANDQNEDEDGKTKTTQKQRTKNKTSIIIATSNCH